MHNHAPDNYRCPICLAINGVEHEDTWIVQNDIFYRDDLVVGFISSKAIKGNDGHPLILPIQHYENIYDLPTEIGHRVSEIAKQTSFALKETRNADGVTLVQNNEPAGDQHAFHYHLHVIPRFIDDSYHTEGHRASRSNPVDRAAPASALREWFKAHS